mmetsp:Transcript_26178/g.57961  ORF Transcript_26178/g.57961 Transcript_26178/m.57961 type:complete len:266 (-) Transcript_26178:45-842(-)
MMLNITSSQLRGSSLLRRKEFKVTTVETSCVPENSHFCMAVEHPIRASYVPFIVPRFSPLAPVPLSLRSYAVLDWTPHPIRHVQSLGAYSMYLRISDDSNRSLTLFCTYSFVTCTCSPALSGASNDISSITRSITVCSLLAPIFSTDLFAMKATRAISRIAKSSKTRSTFSDFISSTCCRMRFVTGSVRIRYMSSSVRPLSVTLMGNRPCSSASRSEGLEVWKAPDAINRMKSVLTLPCLVEMEEPSISGSRSLCTPSEEASAPL